jgi:hypothetical protein
MSDDSTSNSTPPQRPAKPAQPPLAPGGRKSDPAAAERLAAALRENLRRRKQQARSRSRPGPDEADGTD